MVVGRSDRVPFYIEQVVNDFSHTRVLEPLYEPLFTRLRASPTVVSVVEAAAVIGGQMDRGLLCSVVDLGEDEIDDAIRRTGGIISARAMGTDSWRFRHELLREVARRWRRRVADALSGGAGGEPDWRLVAGHYEQAENSKRLPGLPAGRGRGAPAEARTNLSLAVARPLATGHGPRPPRDGGALDARFPATTARADPAESASDFERCLRVGKADLRDDEVFANVELRLRATTPCAPTCVGRFDDSSR